MTEEADNVEVFDEDAPIEVTDYHRAEVLALANAIGDMFDRSVVEATFTQSDPEVLVAAQEISGSLGNFYLLVGSKLTPEGGSS